jgi:membrane-associated phospholipid phosphatase
MISPSGRENLSPAPSAEAVGRSTAFWASVALSISFLAIYGGCNWISAQRSLVPSFFFSWERRIPFIPLMILPYMSIDLFFVSAPFLCRTKRELNVLARRLGFALAFGGVCFLVFPLRFAFERPAATGPFGAIFEAFRHLDQPYNLVPSLHVAMLICLAPVYTRRTGPALRAVLVPWFFLIAVSTLLTYQHHFIDVIGGFILGIACLYMFPDADITLPVLPNRRIGLRYAMGAALASVIAPLLWPWGALLIWPTASLAIVASAYFGMGPRIFRKTSGRLPFSARLLLAPCLLGQYLSWRYYARNCRKWDEAAPCVLIGRRLNHRDARDAAGSGISAVLDLTAEFSEATTFLKLAYLNVPILDLTAPTQAQLKQMAQFITEHAAKKGTAYVHCKVG